MPARKEELHREKAELDSIILQKQTEREVRPVMAHAASTYSNGLAWQLYVRLCPL